MFSAIAVPLAVVLSLVLALMLECRIPCKSLLRTFFLSPMMVLQPVKGIVPREQVDLPEDLEGVDDGQDRHEQHRGREVAQLDVEELVDRRGMKKKRYFGRFALTLLAAGFAIAFLLPTVLTISNSFMTQSEISANYGQVFKNISGSEGKTYIAETVNLKFIPDKVSISQYVTTLIKSPDYLLKFWNSVILGTWSAETRKTARTCPGR